MTLLQLNRHLDDMHAEVEPLEKDDITSWFRKRMLKAKTFQPVAALNQKLKGLDVFEANDFAAASSNATVTVSSSSSLSSPGHERDSDFFVTRAHWQKSYGDDYCLDPSCRRPLGVVNGCVNCRKCGRLFCEEHTMYQIKLSRSAQHEPVRGYWSRVCETCYVSREGFNDTNGVVRDHSEAFRTIRKRKVERACLEVTRLEKRLTKVLQPWSVSPAHTLTLCS
jgi:rabenosyn-5